MKSVILQFFLLLILLSLSVGCLREALWSQNDQSSSMPTTTLPSPIPNPLSAEEYQKLIVERKRKKKLQRAREDKLLESDVEATEYEIYSFVLNHKTSCSGYYVVRDRASSVNFKQEQDKLKKGFPELSEEFFDKNRLMDKKPGQLHKKFLIPCEVKLFNREEGDELFKEDLNAGWKAYWQKYPNGSALISFSRVLFNKSYTEAVFYHHRISGSLIGSGGYRAFKKSNGIWRELKHSGELPPGFIIH